MNLIDNSWRVASTASTAFVVKGIVAMATDDETILYAGLGVGALIGATMAFKVIPQLMAQKAYKTAIVTGSILACSYVLNTDKIHSMITKTNANNNNGQFENMVKNRNTNAVIDYSSLETKKRLLEVELTDKVINKSEIKSNTKIYISDFKSSHPYSEYKVFYTKLANKNGCRLPISFKRLVNCVSDSEISTKTLSINKERNEINKEIQRLSIRIMEAKAKNKNIKKLEKKINRIKKAGEEKAISKDIIALALFVFGLIVEVFFIGFDMIKDILHQRRMKEIKEKEVNETEEEIKETSLLSYRKDIHNLETYEYLNRFCNLGDTELNYSLYWKNGRGVPIGTPIALSNSIVGAFVFASTIKKNESLIDSWSNVNVSDILYINGKDNNDTIEAYRSNITDATIKTLGSTANALNVLVVEDGKKKRKRVNPQLEALKFLRKKEELNPNRFRPQNINVNDMIALCVSFTKSYYPNQF